MKDLSCTEFDPFDHGTTTITYKKVSGPRYDKLSEILAMGWGIRDPDSIEQVYEGAEKASNNFKVDIGIRDLLLKESHINDPATQDLVNRCVAFCEDMLVPAPHLIPARDKSYFVDDKVYCLYHFIDGEHFDGSQKEMKRVAVQLGNFHHILRNIPYKDEIKDVKGTLVKHDRKELEKIIAAARSAEKTSEFDDYVSGILDEIDETSQEIASAEIDELPMQVIHYDVHPHNMLFDRSSRKLLAFLDFDPMLYSQRVRDVGFAMHRFARTYGKKTEKQKDIGADIRHRGRFFLQVYNKIAALTDKEMKAIPLVIQDEALMRVMTILGNHYLRNDDTWSFDLPKQVTTLREGSLFNF